MAFRRKDLTLISGAGPGGPRLWSYVTSDTAAEVAGANYFGSIDQPAAEVPELDPNRDRKSARFDRATGLRDVNDATRNDMKVGDVIFGHCDRDSGNGTHNIFRCTVSSTAAITVGAGTAIT